MFSVCFFFYFLFLRESHLLKDFCQSLRAVTEPRSNSEAHGFKYFVKVWYKATGENGWKMLNKFLFWSI